MGLAAEVNQLGPVQRDEALMRQALELLGVPEPLHVLDRLDAAGVGPDAVGVVGGDPEDIPVAALVVDSSGQLLSQARNSRHGTVDPTAHAEVLALRAAAERTGSWRLDGCTLVVTLEPCPMCAGAAVSARVARVVFGAWNPRYGAAGSVWDLLRDRRLHHRPEVVAGVLAEQAAAPLAAFFERRRQG